MEQAFASTAGSGDVDAEVARLAKKYSSLAAERDAATAGVIVRWPAASAPRSAERAPLVRQRHAPARQRGRPIAKQDPQMLSHTRSCVACVTSLRPARAQDERAIAATQAQLDSEYGLARAAASGTGRVRRWRAWRLCRLTRR